MNESRLLSSRELTLLLVRQEGSIEERTSMATALMARLYKAAPSAVELREVAILAERIDNKKAIPAERKLVETARHILRERIEAVVARMAYQAKARSERNLTGTASSKEESARYAQRLMDYVESRISEHVLKPTDPEEVRELHRGWLVAVTNNFLLDQIDAVKAGDPKYDEDFNGVIVSLNQVDDETGCTIDDILPAGATNRPEVEFAAQQVKEALAQSLRPNVLRALELRAAGYSHKQIARSLGIAYDTARHIPSEARAVLCGHKCFEDAWMDYKSVINAAGRDADYTVAVTHLEREPPPD